MGRKRKPGARYRCGKKRPEAPRDDVMETALLARQRHFRISRQAAKRREAGFAYGQALMAKAINQKQFDALEAYDINRADHRAAVDYRRQRSASDYSQRGGFDAREGNDPSYSDWCDSVIEKFNIIRRAILESGPLSHMAVQTWVDENQTVWPMIPDLRIAANAIDRAINPQRMRRG